MSTSADLDSAPWEARHVDGVYQWEIDEHTKLPNIPRERVVDFGQDQWPYPSVMDAFWAQCEDWLAVRGYQLYPRKRVEGWPGVNEVWEWNTPPHSTSAPYPFATCFRKDGTMVYNLYVPLRIAWAQDSQGRDVSIKLINVDTDEHRIYEDLLNCAALWKPGAGVLPPIAILHTPFRYAFVVMPRWGPTGSLEELGIVADIMHFMRCTLQGLAMLHSHRIAHRDIFDNNILVNYYNHEVQANVAGPILAEYRKTHDVYYSLFNFNLSVKLPLSTSLWDCLLPASEAMITCSPYKPPDVALGEHAYNPFAFDVACLGKLFMVHFHAVVAIVPLLAPMFDKMTTPNARQRFTAQEALEFLDFAVGGLSSDALASSVTLETVWRCQDPVNGYWTKTPPGFVAIWSDYKIPPAGWLRHLLIRLCALPMGWQIIRTVRGMLHI